MFIEVPGYLVLQTVFTLLCWYLENRKLNTVMFEETEILFHLCSDVHHEMRVRQEMVDSCFYSFFELIIAI